MEATILLLLYPEGCTSKGTGKKKKGKRKRKRKRKKQWRVFGHFFAVSCQSCQLNLRLCID